MRLKDEEKWRSLGMMIDDVKVAFGAYLIHIKNRDVQIPIPPFEILN